MPARWQYAEISASSCSLPARRTRFGMSDLIVAGFSMATPDMGAIEAAHNCPLQGGSKIVGHIPRNDCYFACRLAGRCAHAHPLKCDLRRKIALGDAQLRSTRGKP